MDDGRPAAGSSAAADRVVAAVGAVATGSRCSPAPCNQRGRERYCAVARQMRRPSLWALRYGHARYRWVCPAHWVLPRRRQCSAVASSPLLWPEIVSAVDVIKNILQIQNTNMHKNTSSIGKNCLLQNVNKIQIKKKYLKHIYVVVCLHYSLSILLRKKITN